MLRDEIDYAEFRRRAVAARLARLGHRPNMCEVVTGQPPLLRVKSKLTAAKSDRGGEDFGTRAPRYPVTFDLSRVRSKHHGE